MVRYFHVIQHLTRAAQDCGSRRCLFIGHGLLWRVDALPAGKVFHPPGALQHDEHPVPARVAGGGVGELPGLLPVEPGVGVAGPPDALRILGSLPSSAVPEITGCVLQGLAK